MANSKVRPAFNQQVVVLPIDVIVPQKELSAEYRKSTTYKRISSSLEHIGLIEPVVVYPRGPRDYLLLDGHTRLDILKQSGVAEVRALFAMDDEAYTYNKKVNHAPPVAEHFMMLKALSHGATEERLAQVLNVSISAIRQRRNMLDGICKEATEILRNSDVCAGVFGALKKMNPIRQIEAAEQMHAAGTYSVRFAQALLEVTRPEFLVGTTLKCKPTIEATSKAAQAMLEQETDLLIRELKAVEESYGTDMLTLSIACGYIERLFANSRVEKHLEKHHPDIAKGWPNFVMSGSRCGNPLTMSRLCLLSVKGTRGCTGFCGGLFHRRRMETTSCAVDAKGHLNATTIAEVVTTFSSFQVS